MPIVGGLDIHRKQLTFDYMDTETGEVSCGRVQPADREHLAAWLTRQFAGRTDVEFVMEGCTGWRYVAEELTRARVVAHLGEPADISTLRGKKKHAKTDRADARHLRQLLADDRVPECWVPPAHVLEDRAMLGLYHDLRVAHTGWVRRIHAVFFHQGGPVLADGSISTPAGREVLPGLCCAYLSPVGQAQVQAAARMLDVLEEQMSPVRAQVATAARHLVGAQVLAEHLYGVGPMTALALTCWLGGAGRFSSSRQAVRFVGLDVTVHSSDGKRTRGRLSRQGPPVLRWLLYEAGKTHARDGAPDHDYYGQVAARQNGKRASLSQARKITRVACHLLTELGDDALTLT